MGKRVMVLLTDPELVTESVADKTVVTGVQTYDLLVATGHDLGEPLTDKRMLSLYLLALPLTNVVNTKFL